jgi:uncharacterized HAD superfamily protein
MKTLKLPLLLYSSSGSVNKEFFAMTITLPRVGVDCDDVLLDFMRALFVYLNQRLNLAFTYEELISYNLAEFLSLSEEVKQAYVEEFYGTSAFCELVPIEGAIDAIRELVHMCELVVITSRHKEHETHTRNNLELHYPQIFRELHLLGHYDKKVRPENRESKGVVCKRMGIIACIEDGPGNAREIAEAGVPVILPDRPWNQGEFPPLVQRVYSWPEIVACVRALINK